MAEKRRLDTASSDEPLDMTEKDSLDREYNSFCNNLETIRDKVLGEWTEQWCKAIKKSAVDFGNSVFEMQDKIDISKQQLAAQKERSAAMKELCEKVNKLETNKEKLQSEVNEQQKKVDEEKKQLNECTKDVDALEKLTMIKKEKVLKALSFFKERLGLQFISLKAEDQIKVIFTKVDAGDLDRECSFCTKILDSKYYISQCEPTVDQLDEHIEELNISNDFAKFIIKMRKAFRRNLMKENDQNFSVNIM